MSSSPSSLPSSLAQPLAGRVIAVTGAGRGIGRSVVENCLARGARVAALDIVIDPQAAATAAAATPDTLLVRVCDVTSEASVVATFQAIVAHFGRLDGLVNNAGMILEKALADTTMEDFDKVVAVNLRGPFLCAKVAVSHFQQQDNNAKDYPPRIVTIASEIAHSGLAEYAAYTASKGGVYSLTRSLALELAKDQILVNAVAPGPTDTPMLQSEKNYPAWQQGEGIPLGRLGTPGDVAKAVCFLLGPDATFITGSTIDVNGGAVMY
jgi:3-oxoacyl-[acyl-carrier protein] reductase